LTLPTPSSSCLFAREERKFFVIKLASKYYVLKVQAQGADLSPLISGRVAALISRLTQGIFCPNEVPLQTFVDDPCFVFTGTRACIDAVVATIIIVSPCLGFPLSYRKGQLGTSVTWIGANLVLQPDVVIASIKQNILDDLKAQLAATLSSNIVSKKDLQSLAGRANDVATLLVVWRPFLQQLWAALSSDTSAAPRNCVWTKMFRKAVIWLTAFPEGTTGSITRPFSVLAYMGQHDCLEFILDASPWGMGGILFVDETAASWFAVTVLRKMFPSLGNQSATRLANKIGNAFLLIWLFAFGAAGGCTNELFSQ
jgi:hypothetical protein